MSLCTYPTGSKGNKNSVFDDNVGCFSPIVYIVVLSFLQLKANKNKNKNFVIASELFYNVQHIYKDWDYRCLVPYSHKDPTKWKTYDMHGYRKAFNKKQLKKVDQFKYDNNFYNWADPKVLKYFTKSTKSLEKAWKKTYGFPYVSPITWASPGQGNKTECFKKCAHYVSS